MVQPLDRLHGLGRVGIAEPSHARFPISFNQETRSLHVKDCEKRVWVTKWYPNRGPLILSPVQYILDASSSQKFNHGHES